MQQVTVREQIEYASLGWRFTAVLIDTAVLVSIWVAVLIVDMVVLMGQSSIDPKDAAAAQELSREISQKIITQQLGNSSVLFYVILFGSLFIYYLVLEAIFAASIGKLVCGMRVTMADGSRPTRVAILVRNLVRVPEAMFFYIPSGMSCGASPHRQRLGDYAAHTVVVRRRTTVAGAAPGAGPWGPPAVAPPFAPPQYGVPPAPAAPSPAASPDAWPDAAPAAPAGPVPVADALLRLKTAALAARGAHLNYLHFSERELAAGADDPERSYSEEYVSAWFTLTDAVAELRTARQDAAAAAEAAGQDAGRGVRRTAGPRAPAAGPGALLRRRRRRGDPRGVPRRRPLGRAPILRRRWTAPRRRRPCTRGAFWAAAARRRAAASSHLIVNAPGAWRSCAHRRGRRPGRASGTSPPAAAA